MTQPIPQAPVACPQAWLGSDMAQTRDEMEDQSRRLIAMGAKAVLLKGGHSKGSDAEDCLVIADAAAMWYSAPFIDTKNTHGTGCSLSSAIASHLALGEELPEAVRRAKAWLSQAIAHADILQIGSGAGPVHHFHQFWD